MNAVCIIQARLSSRRLPGKMLLTLADGVTLLDAVHERCRRSGLLVTVATSLDTSDDALADHCAARGYRCERGPLDDVLARTLQAAGGAEHIVRVCGDSPFVDPGLLERLVMELDRADYASVRRADCIAGLEGEAVRQAALSRAASQGDLEAADREHVTRYLLRHPEQYGLAFVSCALRPADLSEAHLTVDTQADLVLARTLYARLQAEYPAGDWDAAAVLAMLRTVAEEEQVTFMPQTIEGWR